MRVDTRFSQWISYRDISFYRSLESVGSQKRLDSRIWLC